MKTLYITCKVEYPEKFPEIDVVNALESLLESVSSKVRKSKREAARHRAEKLLKHAKIAREESHEEGSVLDQPTPETV